MLRPAAVAALLLLGGASAVIVPPPTDVTVSCHNLTIKLRWEYSREQPPTSFRVEVRRPDVFRVYETTDHEFDLSHFVWESEEHFMDFLYVAVTAMQGGNQSEPGLSQSFSYNSLKTTHIKCLLEFPPVDLTEGELGAAVSFKNPLHLYKELQQVDREGGASLKFAVSIGDETLEASCTDHTCRRDVSFPGDALRCVALRGSLCNKDCVSEIQFRETDGICLKTSPDALRIMFALMLAIFAFVIIVITTVICKEKAWKMEKPTSLKYIEHRDEQLHYATLPCKEDYCIATVMHSDAHKKSPSISSEEDSYSTTEPRDGGAILDLQSGDEEYRDGGLSEDRTGDDSADSQKTECVSLDSEEAEEGRDAEDPYDRPHAPSELQDMGDGDVVTCYNGPWLGMKLI